MLDQADDYGPIGGRRSKPNQVCIRFTQPSLEPGVSRESCSD